MDSLLLTASSMVLLAPCSVLPFDIDMLEGQIYYLAKEVEKFSLKYNTVLTFAFVFFRVKSLLVLRTS